MPLERHSVRIYWLACIALAVAMTGCSRQRTDPSSIELPEWVDYNEHIRPILSDKCFSCHGPDVNKREAGLRLDIEAVAVAELPESPGLYAIRPGRPAKSEVVKRIFQQDPDERMPPVDSKLTLTPTEKQLIERWIQQGAEYEPLWSLMPIEEAALPDVRNRPTKNEIDRFIQTRLDRAGLEMAEPASKEILIRRVAFDLTGLPPTLEEIDAFLADDNEDTYQRIIDRYLNTSSYGERMAAWWMDVARYADSDGYLDDKHREFSPWRDWVIQAFNENMPYNKFVTWQLAGDLLPDASQEQILATAFNRLHKKNSEAGIVFEEFRSEYVADRTNTFGKALLGITLECARCHDHKFDPITQKEYYQLYAFFNSTNEIGHAVYGPDQTPGPALLLADENERNEIDRLQNEIRRLEAERDGVRQQAESGFIEWSSKPLREKEIDRGILAAQTAYYPFDAFQSASDDKASSPSYSGKEPAATFTGLQTVPGISGKAIQFSDYNNATLGERIGWYDRTAPFTIDLWIYPDTVYADAMIFTHSEEWRLGLRGYTLHLENNRLVFRMAHSYPQNAIQIRGAREVPAREWTRVTLTYDGFSKAPGIAIYQNGSPDAVEIENDNLYKGILFTPDIHTYGFKGIQLGHRDKFTPFKKGRIDEIRVYDRALTALEIDRLYRRDQTSYEADGAQSREALFAHYLTRYDEDYQAITAQLRQVHDSLNTLLNTIPEIMVMGDLETPRATHVLERGMYNALGDEVSAGTPASILSFPEDLPKNRLGLAAWLFHEDNPLAARVIVNRIWKMHFGRGLVETLDDFGNQGDMPSHPRLLDWLANDFRESGWDLKALHKKIMMSAAYQQSSAMRPELVERDPDNVLLARGASFRLPAEMIRDNALAISGLLVEKIGGPSVYPYQPEGLWDELSTKGWRYPYLQEPGEGLYRRSLYSIWKRTSPPPSMLIFDAPDRSTCTVGRQTTSTPLQALVLLNDPQFVEAARKIAERTLLDTGGRMPDALPTLFRWITGRRPSDEESDLLQTFFDDEYRTFSMDSALAKAYLATGASPWNDALDADSLAALAVVANGLMNTDEGYTRR